MTETRNFLINGKENIRFHNYDAHIQKYIKDLFPIFDRFIFIVPKEVSLKVDGNDKIYHLNIKEIPKDKIVELDKSVDFTKRTRTNYLKGMDGGINIITVIPLFKNETPEVYATKNKKGDWVCFTNSDNPNKVLRNIKVPLTDWNHFEHKETMCKWRPSVDGNIPVMEVLCLVPLQDNKTKSK